jgi:hypothetical protein
VKIPLFVIKKLDVDQYWACSAEHGTGWSPSPKQSFSPSELVREVRRLIDEGWYQDVQILRASIEPLPSIEPLSGQASQAPQGVADRAPEQYRPEPANQPTRRPGYMGDVAGPGCDPTTA